MLWAETTMQLHIATLLLLLMEHLQRIFTQSIPFSPCPKMFQYRFDGNEWYALLSVRNPDLGQALHLRVTLSLRGKPTTNYLGEIKLLTRGQFLRDTPVLYKIKFPKHNFPPKLLQISVNSQIICLGATEHSIFVTQIQLEHTRKLAIIPDDLQIPLSAASESQGGTPHRAPLLPGDSEFGTKHLHYVAPSDRSLLRMTKDVCGKIDDRIRLQFLHGRKKPIGKTRGRSSAGGVDIGASASSRNVDRANVGSGASFPLITSDEDSVQSRSFAADTITELPTITRGAWPWLAAIYINNFTSLAYQCGGTLVSSRVVISSAHCFQIFKQRRNTNEVLVFLGRHNLKNWNEEGSLAAPVEDIFIYPDYDSHLNTYDADIAIVMLKHEVRFNTFIRPACLWSGSSSQQYIEGEHGVLVSWNLGNINTNGSFAPTTTVPKVLHAPIISNEECFAVNEKFRSLSSNRTFCAGIVQGDYTQQAATEQLHVKQTRTSFLVTEGLIAEAEAEAEAEKSHIPPTSTPSLSFQGQQTGPCRGDSGAGLMIFKNNRWMLRGTVSASLPIMVASQKDTSEKKLLFACTINQYVIYTDVAKFLDWIFAFIL